MRVEEAETLWADTTDGDLLRHLFGYYPTLHDAQFTEFKWEIEPKRLTGCVDYTDSREDGQSVSAQIALIWTEVMEANLPMDEFDVIDFDFRIRDQRIETWWNNGGGQYNVVAGQFDVEIRRDRPKDPPLRWRIR